LWERHKETARRKVIARGTASNANRMHVATLIFVCFQNRYKDLSAKCDQIKVWNDAVLKAIQTLNNNASTLLICDDAIYNEIFQSLDTLKGKYQDLQNLNNQLQVTIKSKDVELEQLRPIKQLYGNLENSHQQTLQYLKLMKAEIGKLENYRMTIHTQEKVIAKLQSVVESKLKSKFAFLKNISTATATPEIVKGEDNERQASLATENNVEESFVGMQKENEALLEKVSELEIRKQI
jgi:hypothetical protein